VQNLNTNVAAFPSAILSLPIGCLKHEDKMRKSIILIIVLCICETRSHIKGRTIFKGVSELGD
jgi:hypothetical protein